MFDKDGNQTWDVDYDIYGKIRKQHIGTAGDCPFRYQGQCEDTETGLYYNRFRYYSPDSGTYISQDPIKLLSGEPNLYTYVRDSNIWIDIFGFTGTYAFTDGTTFYIGKGDHTRMLASIRQRVGTGNAIRSQHVDFGSHDMG